MPIPFKRLLSDIVELNTIDFILFNFLVKLYLTTIFYKLGILILKKDKMYIIYTLYNYTHILDF